MDGVDFVIGGRSNSAIKYTDDLVLLAKNTETLQDMLDRLVVTGKIYGIELNIEKAEVKKFSKKPEPLRIFVGKQAITKRRSV